MKQKVTLQFAVLLMLFLTLPVAAKVTGLPDFTELVEKAGPAVVNIRVTQFGSSWSKWAHPTWKMPRGEPGEAILKYRNFSGVISMYPTILVVR